MGYLQGTHLDSLDGLDGLHRALAAHTHTHTHAHAYSHHSHSTLGVPDRTASWPRAVPEYHISITFTTLSDHNTDSLNLFCSFILKFLLFLSSQTHTHTHFRKALL